MLFSNKLCSICFIYRINGGVSRSNFICQYLSNILNLPIERSETSSTSSTYGTAFLAGLGAKIFKSVDELEKFRTNVEVFKPEISKNQEVEKVIKDWENALKRFLNWP